MFIFQLKVGLDSWYPARQKLNPVCACLQFRWA